MYLDWIDVSRRTAQARCTKWGSNGGRSGCIPASSGSRLPFRVLHVLHAVNTLVHAFVPPRDSGTDRKSTRLNSSHLVISYAVFCLKKKKKKARTTSSRTIRSSIDSS